MIRLWLRGSQQWLHVVENHNYSKASHWQSR